MHHSDPVVGDNGSALIDIHTIRNNQRRDSECATCASLFTALKSVMKACIDRWRHENLYPPDKTRSDLMS